MKQNKTMRRIFSLLLCLSMVLVYIPVSAFAVSMTGGEKLYLVPNSNWTEANARFAAYFFGTGDAWASMTLVAGETNRYEVTVPAGNWTNVIFCRMNPNTDANNWDTNTKWNQTSDLTFDGTKNCYTVGAGAWDYGAGAWSVYTPPTVGDVTYAVNVVVNDGGKVVAPETAAEGKEVVLAVTPDVGYRLESLTYTNGDETNDITNMQFTMPAGDVTITATFRELTDEEEVTIYYQNNWSWTDICVYYWGSAMNQGAGWPGAAMVLVEDDATYTENGTYEVYSFDVPADAAGYIITGKMDGSEAKTVDLTVGDEDGICYKLSNTNAEGHYYVSEVDPAAESYTITVTPTENGTVNVPQTAAPGEEVTLSVSANVGYRLDSLTVMNGEKPVEVTNAKFVMPAGDVTVTATFRELTDDEKVTVYFQNNWLWENVKIYYWGSAMNECSSWPGIAMTNLGKEHAYSQGEYEVYTFEIPADVEGFLINNGDDTGNVTNQSPDITEGFADGICYRMFWNDKNEVQIVPDPSVKYDITVEAAENGEVVAPENAAEEELVTLTVTPAEGYELASLTVLFGEEELTVTNNQFVMPGGSVTVSATFQLDEDPGDEPEEKTTMTVYFQNNWLWTDVNAYYWGSTTNTNPIWPGVAMTKVENPVAGYSNNGEYEVYSIEVPLDATGLIINGTKNDGSGDPDQTPNIEEGFFDGICYYMYWDNANKAGAMISPDVLGVDTPVNTWNISLGDDIGVNFVVDSNVANLLEFCIGETVLAKQVTANGDGTSTVSVGLAAAQMADIITIKGCGTAYEKTYSVVDYAKDILGGEYSDETKALITEMLNYGAAAQEHFDYNKENLANTGISEVLRNEMDLSAVAESACADSVNGLGYYGASLLFRNKIAVRFYFTGSVEGCTFTVGENTYEPVLKDGRYYVEVADIAPDALDQQITLKVTDANGAEISVTYGPMNYIKRMYEKEDTSESLKDVLENLYYYHKAAEAYVASLSTEA